MTLRGDEQLADDLILHPEFITCRVKCQSVRDPSSDNICHPIAVRNRLRIDAQFGILGWGLGRIFFIQVISSFSFIFSSSSPFHLIFTVLLLYYSLPLFFCFSSLFHYLHSIFLHFFFFPIFLFFFSILFLFLSSSLSYFPFPLLLSQARTTCMYFLFSTFPIPPASYYHLLSFNDLIWRRKKKNPSLPTIFSISQLAPHYKSTNSSLFCWMYFSFYFLFFTSSVPFCFTYGSDNLIKRNINVHITNS